MVSDQSVTPDDVQKYIEKSGLSQVDPRDQIESIKAQDQLVKKLDSIDTPSAPDREYWEPDESKDPNAAFLTKLDLYKSDSGALNNMTVAVKDNIAVGGVPMTCGSPFLEDFIPASDATVVTRILQEGGRIVAKANMDEFALGGDTDAMRFRLARNPNNTEHQPGGSSAGSGVAVADGLTDIALGTDTGGSVRFPASFCGVVGVKPSRGLVPLTGFVQFSKINDTIGVLADTVSNAARGLSAIAGEDAADEATSNASPAPYHEITSRVSKSDTESLTIGVPDELFGINEEVEETVHAAIDQLESAGATVRAVSIPEFEYSVPAWWVIAMTEAAAYMTGNGVNYWQLSESHPDIAAAIGNAFENRPETLGKFITEVMIYGQHLIEEYKNQYYAKAQRIRPSVERGIDSALTEVDVLVGPTAPMVAPKWGEGYLEDGSLDDAVRTTAPFNLTGHPAISVPCGKLGDLPVGLQFVAERMNDEIAFKAARAWETVYSG